MPRKQHTYHYIYKTTCKINRKYYVGMHSTSNLEDGYIGSGKKLWNSIRKYGRENHEMEILEWFLDRKALGEREKEIVSESLLQDPLCMNLKMGGEYSPGTYGKKYSDESRKKMSQWKRPKELGQKISQKLSGKKLSIEHCESIRKAKTGKPNPKKAEQMRGNLLDEETQKKISKKLTGRKLSEETKKKMSKSQTGKKHIDEAKLKMSLSKKTKLEEYDWEAIQKDHETLFFSEIRAKYKIPYNLFFEAENCGLFKRIKHKRAMKESQKKAISDSKKQQNGQIQLL